MPRREQYICTVCGFNMIGSHPDFCPFCGAARSRFITSAECTSGHSVVASPVAPGVLRLDTEPKIGFPHSAYRVETELRTYWIDCPSCFDPNADQTDVITFTHHHFLGASNLYREHLSAEIRIHRLDSLHDICRPFPFDVTFRIDFSDDGLDAYHIGGHTPGFTLYIFQDILFIGDYVFVKNGEMTYNPFGPAEETVAGGERIRRILAGRDISRVCGYDYVMDFPAWHDLFVKGPLFYGH